LLDSLLQEIISRMGVLICDICGIDGKYKCPRCDTRSCSVQCSKKHKDISGCDGVRRKITYVAKEKFTELNLVQDFRILESVTNAVDRFRRDEMKKFTNQSQEGFIAPRISFKKRKLLTEAARRGVYLKHLPANFARSKNNGTCYDNYKKTLYWDVELNLVHLDTSLKFTKLADTTKLWKLLAPLLEPNVDSNQLGFVAPEINLDEDERNVYVAMGYSGLKVYLRTETYKRRRRDELTKETESNDVDECSQNRYTELDLKRSLRHNLRGHALVEHPCLEVVSKWEACNYRDQIAVNIFNQTDHKLDKQQIEEEEQVEEVDDIEESDAGNEEDEYTQYYNFYLDYYLNKYNLPPQLPSAHHVLNSPVDPYDSIIKLSQQNNLNHQQNISAPNVTNQQPAHVSVLNSQVDPYDSVIKLSHLNNLNQQQTGSAPNVACKQPGHVSKANIDEVNKENAENARKIAAEIRESIVESNNEDIQVEKSENTNMMLGLVAYSDSDSDSE